MESLLDRVGQKILENEQQPGIIDPVRYQQLQLSYNVLEELTADTDMQISYEIHEPFNSVGSITLKVTNWSLQTAGGLLGRLNLPATWKCIP